MLTLRWLTKLIDRRWFKLTIFAGIGVCVFLWFGCTIHICHATSGVGCTRIANSFDDQRKSWNSSRRQQFEQWNSTRQNTEMILDDELCGHFASHVRVSVAGVWVFMIASCGASGLSPSEMRPTGPLNARFDVEPVDV
jgi:hypothetical protein